MKKMYIGITVFLFSVLYPYLINFIIDFLPKNIMKQIPDLAIYLTLDIILMLIFFFVYKKELKEEWSMFKNNWKTYLENNVSYWIMGLVLMAFSNLIITNIISKNIPENEKLIKELFKNMPVYTLFTTVVVAPFVEELIYRKSVRHIFKNDKIYIVISGLLFGLAHVIYSYKGLSDFLFVIPYGILGGAFALMYVKTKTIFVPMTFHFVHNFLAMAMTLILYLL